MKKTDIIEWVLPCKRLPDTLVFYTRQLDFRVDAIFPADAPRVAQLSGYGIRVRLEQCDEQAPRSLRLISERVGSAGELTSPDGTRIERALPTPELKLPPLQASCVIQKKAEKAGVWGEGRAGMHYRDLVPDRQGGALIASHIRIAEGGPVPDYVHHHLVLFQLIYCAKGWVKVVYEDQGPEFVLQEGDCVLQPPGIRHRVLESSDGLEVIEVSAPAEHMTFVDHEMQLPTPEVNPEREFAGQKFIRHQVANATWQSGEIEGFDLRDIGLTAATNGVISLHVLRANGTGAIEGQCQDHLQFFFVLQGSAELQLEGQSSQLAKDDAFVIPAELEYGIKSISQDLQVLRLSLHRYSI